MTENKAQKSVQRDFGYQPVEKGYQPVEGKSSNPTPPKGGSGVPPKPKNNK